MKTLRAFLCLAALLFAFATPDARADDSDSVGSGPVGPVESESAGPVGSSDSSETVLVAKAGTGKATQVDRWLIVALIAVLGLPQLSAMWERHRRRRRGLAAFCISE